MPFYVIIAKGLRQMVLDV